jgi:hypothetical protein
VSTSRLKFFELRDRGTFIPIVCVLMEASNAKDAFLLTRSGYSTYGPPLVLLSRCSGGGRAHYDPYAWGDRTFTCAHEYITDRWDDLSSGCVVDVQFILGESERPVEPEINQYDDG